MSSAIGKSTDNYIPLASPASLEEGSAPDASPKSARWSKICNWCKAHEKELVATAIVIAIIAGIALTYTGAGILALAVAGSTAEVTGLLMLTEGLVLTIYMLGMGLIAMANYNARGK